MVSVAKVGLLQAGLLVVYWAAAQVHLAHLSEIEGGAELLLLVYALVAVGVVLHEHVARQRDIRRYGREAPDRGTAGFVPWAQSDYPAQPDGSTAGRVYQAVRPAARHRSRLSAPRRSGWDETTVSSRN